MASRFGSRQIVPPNRKFALVKLIGDDRSFEVPIHDPMKKFQTCSDHAGRAFHIRQTSLAKHSWQRAANPATGGSVGKGREDFSRGSSVGAIEKLGAEVEL